MASVALVFRLVVCLTVLNHGPYFISTTAAFPAQETCHVSTVTEGESAVMTFKIRSGIDTASKTFYAHLRRNDCELTDIVTCDGLKVACDVKDGHPMFQVDTITEHKLTVHISNMSRELEDTYVLQVFFNGIPEPVSSCTLNITYTQTITTIITDVETEDQNDWNAVLITVAIIIIIIILVAAIVRVFFWERVKPVVQQCTGGQTMETHEDRTVRAERSIPTRANPCKEKGVKPAVQQCTGGKTMDTHEVKPVVQQCTGGHTMDTNYNTNAPDIESPGDPEQIELEEERTRLLSDDSTSLGNHTRVSLDPHRAGKPTNKEQLSRSQGQSPEKTRAGKPTNKEQLSRSQGQSPEKTSDTTDNKADKTEEKSPEETRAGKPTNKEQLSRSQGQSPEKTSDTTDNKADKTEEKSPEETRDRTDNIEDPSRTTAETSFEKAGAGTDINVEQSSTTEGKLPQKLGAESYTNAEQALGKEEKSPKTLGDRIKTKPDTCNPQSKLRKLRWDPKKADTVLKEDTLKRF